MPYRKTPLVAREIYHVFNRSVARQPIFLSQRHYRHIVELINFYRFEKPPIRYSYFDRLNKEQKEIFIKLNMQNKKPMISILAYCLMPNHFHFLLKPTTDTAVSAFMRNLQNSYSKYFNTKHKRSGSLFQSMFKAVRIETEEQLIHVSRYIHLNPVSSSVIHIKDLERYPWSSFNAYLTGKKFVEPDIILKLFSSPAAYKSFVFDNADYQKTLENIKHLTLE